MSKSRESPKNQPYRVLARTYRPRNFEELIGQEALVRILKNAIETGRIAHAFMLTGVRGVGKTTTARIIAKALNYTGPDGKGQPTAGPTDDCALCRAIGEDRHPDVIEMDAASHTGVEDVREILDGVRYAPTEARYKIYIIDEVHMLSKNAFNALLKTLEEPPPHVKFIFATTEIRKVPVTVLSRCQRFDLRRVDAPTLAAHFKAICAKEKVKAEDEALAMIAQAADGSVRDGLSLLDQAIALGGDTISAQQVRDMLGLADRARSLELLDHALGGEIEEALGLMDDLYKSGADPLALLQDLLDLTHMLTRLRAAPEAEGMKHIMASDELDRMRALAKKLTLPALGKAWQVLLKGIGEVHNAPHPQNAAEMIIIRLAYAADLPDPADLIKKLKDQPAEKDVSFAPSVPGPSPRDHTVNVRPASGRTQAAVKTEPQALPEQALASLSEIVSVLEQNGEYVLAGQVYQAVHLVKLEEGRLEIRPAPEAPPRLAQDLGQQLGRITGRRWIVSVSQTPGQATLAEQAGNIRAGEFAAIMKLPQVQDILKVFPDARLTDIIASPDKKEG